MKCRAVIVALFVTASAAVAQHAYTFEHLGVAEGLSQNNVMCIFQDRQGFMWLGTQDGLNRHDGYNFKVFRHDVTDPGSINDNFIRSIAETPDGTLWIQTLNYPEVWNRYDPLDERFVQVPADSVTLAKARVSSVYQSFEDDAGVRWTGSIGEGLQRFDPRTGETTRFNHDPSDPGSLADNRVYSVTGDRTGIIWVGTREGLNRYDPATGKFKLYRHDPADPTSLSDNWVWPILQDRSGTLWIGTFRGGLNRYDPAADSFTHFRHIETDPRSLSDDRIFSLYQDRSGVIWVGASDHGVDRFHPEMNFFKHYVHDPNNPRSLSNNSIIGAYVDRSGTAWIGTRGGLNRLDRATDTFRHYANDPANPKSIADNNVISLLEDRSGVLWIGTESSGLDRMDRATGTFTHYRHDPNNPKSLSDNRVYALLEDRTGTFWVGTYGGGLNRFDRSTGSFFAYTHRDSDSTSLAAKGVWALCEDQEGTLWVGTYGGGLDRFDRRTETFTHYQHDETDPASLSSDLVICLHVDRTGILWVGTDAGLNKFDRAAGTFKHYGQKEGLPNDYVFGILEDNRGMLWLSTNKGLSRLNPQDATIRNYDYSDGLQGNEFNQAAYARDPGTGEMYFGGGNGFNLFHPDSVRDNAFLPPVVFSAFTRYNTDDEEGRPLPMPGIAARQAITLSYKDNIANIEFAALNYYNTPKNRYAYQLEGFSENWIQLGTERRATFTNLDAGEYTLRVRGSNSDGLWSSGEATLSLTVTPPWWKTRWAYGTYIVLAFAFLYGIRAAEIKRREQKTQIRESQLRAKAAEAEKRALQAENERKTKELEDARQLQLSMLPREVPKLPQYDISVFMKTATEVGGDYYDFSVAEDGTLNIAFGDATGHGMQAGTIVTLMKGLFLSDATRFDIQTFLSHCSRAIKEIKLGRLFMAFTLVRLRGRQVGLSTAGMPPAFLYRRADGSVEEILLKGMPLGAMKNFPYQVHATELCPGDTLVLLTDGLPEQKNGSGQMFDYDRVRGLLASSGALPPEKIIESLVHEGESWMAGIPQDDDITIMAIRLKEPTA